MGKVFGIDLGTTYSCIAYIDEAGKPVVLKNAEGDLTTPSAVFFESQTDVTVGSAAKESAKMYPDQVVTFIKRSIGQPGFSLNLNGIDMKPEEISSYILKKVVQDAEETLRMEGKLGDSEQVFSLVLCRRSDGAVEEVYWRSMPYTSDATSLFRIWLNSVCDLNGDGEPEVLLRDGRWEWGHVYVMARDGDGAWQRVLQADSGM